DQGIASIHDQIEPGQKIRTPGHARPTQLFFNAEDRAHRSRILGRLKDAQHAVGQAAQRVTILALTNANRAGVGFFPTFLENRQQAVEMRRWPAKSCSK
ncbi:MAG TPA: hypothetical protein VGP68_05460, partial [Gemmataceae bacterium]|nr:hypothetical protein [Gemmataceae bacterium]